MAAVGGAWGLQPNEEKICFMWWANEVFGVDCPKRHLSELWQK